MSNLDAYLRPDHRVGPTCPITIKVDSYGELGKGQSDMHYDVELGIMLKGNHRRWHAENEDDYGAGDFWMCGIWEPHRTEVLEVPVHMVMFHIYPPFLAQLQFPEAPHINWLRFFSAPPDSRPRNNAHASKWLEYGEKMVNLAEPMDWKDQIKQRLLLQELLLDITVHYGLPKSNQAEPSLYTTMTPAIDAVLATGDYISVEHAASLCHVSRRVFSDRFKQLTGLNFTEFALRHRLSGAAKDLLNPDMSVKVIASTWGFTDSSHFHRHFTSHFGCGPEEWRKNQSI